MKVKMMKKDQCPCWIATVNNYFDKEKNRPSAQKDLSKFIPAKKARDDKHEIKRVKP